MGLGSPEVVEGASGHLVLRGGMRLAARITEVVPGKSWSWQVGGLHIRHSVRPVGTGSRIEHMLEGASRPWSLAARAYAPIVGLIARNIARVAERDGLASPKRDRQSRQTRLGRPVLPSQVFG